MRGTLTVVWERCKRSRPLRVTVERLTKHIHARIKQKTRHMKGAVKHLLGVKTWVWGLYAKISVAEYSLKGRKCLEGCALGVFLILSPKKKKMNKAFFRFSRMLDHRRITGTLCQKVIAGNLIENIGVDLKNVSFSERLVHVRLAQCFSHV